MTHHSCISLVKTLMLQDSEYPVLIPLVLVVLIFCQTSSFVEDFGIWISLSRPNAGPLFFFKKNFYYLFILLLFLFTLQYCIGFAIHQHAPATGVHVFPIILKDFKNWWGMSGIEWDRGRETGLAVWRLTWYCVSGVVWEVFPFFFFLKQLPKSPDLVRETPKLESNFFLLFSLKLPCKIQAYKR